MVSKTFDDQIGRLQKVFNGNYNAESITLLWRDIKGHKDEYLVSAVDTLINSRQVKFGIPTNKEIALAVFNAYEADWEKKKREERSESRDLFTKPKTPTHKDFIAMINKFLTTDMTPQDKYNEMLEIGKKYPRAYMTMGDGSGAADMYKAASIRTGRWK